MNPHSFSFIGYFSVLLWLAVPPLLLMRRRIGAPAWLALALSIFALVFATINSRTHVERIEVEASAQTANQLVHEADKRKAVEKARGADVADIRFAEDGSNDFIDKAGLNDADSKYVKSIEDAADPEWKKQKKERGASAKEDNGLENKLGGEKAASGVSSDALPTENKRTPIFMSEAHKATADRLDGINLSISRLAIFICIVMLVVEYLSNANRYAFAAFPLPIPGYWRNTFTPLPAVVHRPQPPRRSLVEELAWLVRRGEVFVCFTKDAAALPANLPRIGKTRFPIDVLRVDTDRISDDFVFEALWYGRCCFVVDSPERTQKLFAAICSQLEERSFVRAITRQTAHIVWDLDQALPDQDIARFERLAQKTGFSLFVSHDSKSD